MELRNKGYFESIIETLAKSTSGMLHTHANARISRPPAAQPYRKEIKLFSQEICNVPREPRGANRSTLFRQFNLPNRIKYWEAPCSVSFYEAII